MADLAVHDSDEHGVPSDADTSWRQLALRRWVRGALYLQGQGRDLMLTGQSPLGELLAVPEASQLDLAVCLLDVDDEQRAARLERRDPRKWSADATNAFGNWARWHRGHAADPAHRPEVITERSAPDMRWDRWASWTRTDPRWHVTTINTSDEPMVATAERVRDWVKLSRQGRDDGSLPLSRGRMG